MGSYNRAAGAIAFLITIYLLAQRMTNSTSVVSAFYNLARNDEAAIDQLFAEYKCHNVYLDVGSNVGVQIRKLFEPEKYPGAPVIPLFRSLFGNDPCSICAIGFEASPRHHRRLETVQSKLRKAGFGVLIFHPVAASDSDGVLDFTFNGQNPCDTGGAHIDCDTEGAASAAATAGHAGFGLSQKVTVRSIDLARIIRHIDKLLHKDADSPGKMMMKLDVEGSEYKVLPHLAYSQSLCLIDVIFIKWHEQFYSSSTATATAKGEGLSQIGAGPMQRLVQSAQRETRNALTLHHGSDCPTKLLDLDDESYPHDNQPWPSERLCGRRPKSLPISTNLHQSPPPRRHEVRCAGCKTYMSDLRAMSRNGSGYLGMAFGLGYLEMVTVQVKLLRKVGDVYPMSLLADHESLAPALGSKLFDHVILYRPECFDDGLNEVTSTAHERWNMLPELRMDLLSPYEEFIKMDTDIVPTSKGTSAIWEAFRRRGCAFDDFGVPFDSSWHWGKLGAINSKLKQEGKIETDMHHTHVGLFYANFKQGRRGSFPAILAQAKSALMRYDELGFERMFRGGAVDEILFSWALATSKHTACMPVPFGDLFAFRYDRSAPHHMVHLFDQASWRAAAVDVLGFNFRLNDTNIKAHSFGSAVVTTCSERRRAKRKEENGVR
jgi:hypothetical protein